MTRVLDELEGYLDWRGFFFLRLDGCSGSAAERGELVRRFNDPGGLSQAAAWARDGAGAGQGLGQVPPLPPPP